MVSLQQPQQRQLHCRQRVRDLQAVAGLIHCLEKTDCHRELLSPLRMVRVKIRPLGRMLDPVMPVIGAAAIASLTTRREISTSFGMASILARHSGSTVQWSNNGNPRGPRSMSRALPTISPSASKEPKCRE